MCSETLQYNSKFQFQGGNYTLDHLPEGANKLIQGPYSTTQASCFSNAFLGSTTLSN